MKKINICLAACLFLFISLHAEPASLVNQYTLENGLSVFLLEDPSEALVRIEFSVKAGFSSQTKDTAGFFYLYSALIQNSSSLNFESVSCNAESSRYQLTVTPSQIENCLQSLSQNIFMPQISDELLIEECRRFKKESEENAQSIGGFLNSAIESRIYSTSPWKHDTGIYPSLFKKNTEKNIRTALKQIADRWYTPQNSAIFISGNISSEEVMRILRSSFGRYYSSYSTPIPLSDLPYNNQKKYVIHSADFSPDISQIIIEYTNLNMDESEVLAASLNNLYSPLKADLLSKAELNIPGEDYIDISSAHSKNSSRLVIQALMQKPEDKKAGITSLSQAKAFMESVENIPQLLKEEDFYLGKQIINSNLKQMTSSSSRMMDSLASFWTLEAYKDYYEKEDLTYPSSFTTELLMQQSNNYSKIELPFVMEAIKNDQPFVFLVISDSEFKKYKKDFTAQGFEEINYKNASWYTNQMYKEIQDQFKPEEEILYNVKHSDFLDNEFYEKNIQNLTLTKLDNGIPLAVKTNSISSGAALMLCIKGGKINSAADHGFEEVMINILGTMIQRELTQRFAKGIILSRPQISTQSEISSSYILIEFEKEDFESVCQGVSNTIIYANLMPAAADRAVASRQHKKRLENGSAVNQMLEAAMTTIYGKSPYSAIYDSKKDILQNTDYTKIVNAYPALLDASRYSIILSGNIPSNYLETIKKNFELLTLTGQSINKPETNQLFPRDKRAAVKITHTFLTDIPAEKAGPQPAVLIPTTEFLDPVLYAVKAPAAGTREYNLFNALVNYIASELQKEVNKSSKEEQTVLVQLPKNNINYAFIIVQNVEHTALVDAAYRKVIDTLKTSMKGSLIADIKNLWILNHLYDASLPSQTAKYLYRGIELFDDQADFYLREYEDIRNANVDDYAAIMSYFPARADLRLYSIDSKN